MQTEQWKALGDKVKAVERELSEIIMDSQKLGITQKGIVKIIRAKSHISSFKCQAENVMLAEANKEGIADYPDQLKVFYG